MATMIELPYKAEAFNQIPSLGDSNNEFLARNGPELLISSIWNLFFKYGLTERYGPALIHRHWSVKSDQAAVDVHGTSTPWSLDRDTDGRLSFQKYGKSIIPCSWVVVNEQLMPYEFFFEYDNDAVDIPTIEPGFVKEFASILDTNGLRNHIGLRLIRDKETKVLEITEGFANVTFPLSEKASARLREQGIPTIEAGWRYPITDISNGDMETRRMIVQNSCTIICRQIDKGHIKVHLGGSGADGELDE